ncbi:MAG: hypothetical protein H8D47_01950 [Planctomycetes bacterium]|nr:hypothetical protein [Planctomycetota bacterium]
MEKDGNLTFYIDPEYQLGLAELGIDSFEGVFKFDAGCELHKKNIANFRTRIKFTINTPPATLYLKRYNNPPLLTQLKKPIGLLQRIATSTYDHKPSTPLSQAGIRTPKVIAHGEQWGKIFEKRSFVITEQIPNADALERKLPECFTAAQTPENREKRKRFIENLADFLRTFHNTGYRHRDLYFAHIFLDSDENFHLIDLARAFKPKIFASRYRIKDIAQLYYSAPAKFFSRTDRFRFYLRYRQIQKLSRKDKLFIRRLKSKTKKMASHDIKHSRTVPFSIR